MKIKNANDYLDEIKDLQSCNRRCICKANAYNKIMTHCPSHDDNVPSLSIKVVDGKSKPIMNCFAGCDYESIYKAFQTWKVW